MSPTGPLLESQETEVFELIDADSRFAPEEFSWDRPPDFSNKSGAYIARGFPTEAMNSQTLVHDPSGFQFEFSLVESMSRSQGARKTHSVEFRPGRETWEEKYDGLSWDDVRDLFAHWLDFVHREYSTINPWEQLVRSRPEAFLPRSVQELPDDQPFSPGQQEELRERLDAVEQEIRSLRDLHEEEIEALHQEIQSLREKLSDLDQKGWTDMAMFRILRILQWLNIEPSELQAQLNQLRDAVIEYSDRISG